MPEYLAPGVYVEETSFRSKSIEGVSTSTTAFVGPTRKGPVAGENGNAPLELLTSFGDFERIYGGLEDLSFGTNYLAHAVRAYFNEGGSRLYVARVYQEGADDGIAQSIVISDADAARRARFLARFPGSGGAGRLALTEATSPATRRTMDLAPEGSLARTGVTGTPAQPARIEGGRPPFSLDNNSVLRLGIGGAADVDVTFRGAAATATGATAMPAQVNVTDANNTVEVTIDGGPVQRIRFANGNNVPRATVVDTLDQEIRGGHARLNNQNRVVITTDTRGLSASVAVGQSELLGFDQAAQSTPQTPASNNVGNLMYVRAEEVNALLAEATQGAPLAQQAVATVSADTGRLLLSTLAVGATASLAVRDAGGNSAHAALGLPTTAAGQPGVTGTAGSTPTYHVKRGGSWADPNGTVLNLGNVDPDAAPNGGAEFVTVTVEAQDGDGNSMVYEELGFAPSHPRWIGSVLTAEPSSRTDALLNLFAFQAGATLLQRPHDLRAGLFPSGATRVLQASQGTDGAEPTAAAYEQALAALEGLEDVSIVAAPGSSAYADHQAIQRALITHAERRRAYRIAVLDTRRGQSPAEVRLERGRIDSKYAALYYPWVVVSNPLFRPGDERIPRELTLPPSGFICGIYARNDIERGVFKAPANEIVRGALRFERDVTFGEQEMLNPIGVNCLRYLPGRGYRVWGARTVSSDQEFKYVNIRRYLNYLERSVDNGTQVFVFEPNGERLWANVRETISDFLYNEWVSGALLGSDPKQAFFVRCDRSTMTQNDLDNGRLIALIGVAIVKPAEFVIFRIGQKTADSRN